jgi:5-methylcytosine-specific restriction endonuclease McrA
VDNDRLCLDVPFAEKDAAKRAGACWDPQMRRWYAPRARAHQLVRWKPLPDLLPGEDRNFGSGLFVDLVPSSCWFTNVRSCVSARDWDRLRLMVYRRAGHRCEACGATKNTDTGVYLEAHERWNYTTYDVQTLKRLVCLCTPCHEVTHFGLASIRERDHQALQHLMAVNQWQDHQAHSHVDDAFRLWRLHS